MNVFKEENGLFEETIGIYHRHGTLYIGVDFDDTIRDFQTGEPINQVVTAIRECNRFGLKVCLYTAREARDLVYALDYCKGIGIVIDYVNYSPLMPHVRKPLFNIFLDDRAGLKEALNELNKIITYLKKNQHVDSI